MPVTDVGRLIAGRYRLVDRIAVGGMGVVWEGRDELLARRVAVKQLLTQPGLSDADALLARHRVIREARITARLHHPQAVAIYDVVDDGDYPCLIMQFVPSSSLTGLLRGRGVLPLSQVERIGSDLAAALHAAHQVGIVHRDVKPGNVLITEDGSAMLTDFGISHAAGDATLTATGMVSGTPAYLAPEVARGGTSGFSADVFSLGATLYACMEGAPPFGLDTNPMAVLHRVASGQMVPPQRSGPLTPLLLQMLAPQPADRPTMSQVSAALAGLRSHTRAPVRPAPVQNISTRTLPVTPSELPAAEPRPANSRPTESDPAALRPANPRSAEPRPANPRSAEPHPAEPAPANARPAEPAPAEPAPANARPAEPAPANAGPAEYGPPAEPTAATPTRSSELLDRRAQHGLRRLPAKAMLAVLGVVLAAVLAGGFLLYTGSHGGQGTVASSAIQDGTGATAPTSEGSSPATESDQPATSAQQSRTTAAAAANSTKPATELAAAVSDYYALMPGNTDAGWARLTPSFQSGIARDREYYNSFWAGVDRVAATDVTGTAPDSVTATITYHFADGRVSVERTAYRLVRQDGVFKIDSSSVLSSTSG